MSRRIIVSSDDENSDVPIGEETIHVKEERENDTIPFKEEINTVVNVKKEVKTKEEEKGTHSLFLIIS